MQYIDHYQSDIGGITLASDGSGDRVEDCKIIINLVKI